MKIHTEDKIQQIDICILSIKEAVTINRFFGDHLENIRRNAYIEDIVSDNYHRQYSLGAIYKQWDNDKIETLIIMLEDSLSLITKYTTIQYLLSDINGWCKNLSENDCNCSYCRSSECDCIDYNIAVNILSKLNNNVEFQVEFDNSKLDIESISAIKSNDIESLPMDKICLMDFN